MTATLSLEEIRERLSSDVDDEGLPAEVASALGAARNAFDRDALLTRALEVWADRPAQATRFGARLYADSWEGCELAAARAYAAALGREPSNTDAMEGLVSCLSYASAVGDFAPVIHGVLRQTGRPVALLSAAAQWFRRVGRTTEGSALSTEAADAAMSRLEARPDDTALPEDLASLVVLVDKDRAEQLLTRALEVWADHPAQAIRLGARLFRDTWEGCELAAARAYAAALRREPSNPEAMEGFVSCLSYAGAVGDFAPVIDDALRHTGRPVALLSAGAQWFRRVGRPEGSALSTEAADLAMAHLEASPDDVELPDEVATVLSALDEDQSGLLLDQVGHLWADRPDSLIDLGLLLQGRGKELEATRALVLALRRAPERRDAIDAIRDILDSPFASGDLDLVVEEALDVSGRPVSLLFAAGHRCQRNGRPLEAAVYLAEAFDGVMLRLETAPGDADLPAEVDLALVDATTEGREALLRRALERWATYPDHAARLGQLLFARRWEGYKPIWEGLELAAARAYLAALRQEPGRAEAIAGLQACVEYPLTAGDFGSVIEDALRVTGRPIRLLAAAGYWYTRVGRTTQAMALYSEAVDAAMHRLASVAADDALPDEVDLALRGAPGGQRARLLERAMEAWDERPKQLVRLGQLLDGREWEGHSLAAARLYVGALRRDPTSTDALDALNSCLQYGEPTDDFGPVIDEALQLVGRPTRTLVAAGRRLITQGDLHAAEKHLLEALQRRIGSADDTVEIADIHRETLRINDAYLDRRTCNKAARWLDRVEAVHQGSAEVALARAALTIARSQPQQAARILSELTENQIPEEHLHWYVALTWEALSRQHRFEALDAFLEETTARHDGLQGTTTEYLIRSALLRSDTELAHRRLARAEEEGVLDYQTAGRLSLALSLADGGECDDADGFSADDLRRAAYDLTEARYRLPLRLRAIELVDREGAQVAQAAVHFECGLDLEELGRHQEAIAEYQRAAAVWTGPTAQDNWLYGPYSYHNMAVSQENGGDFDAAANLWSRAIKEYDAIGADDDTYRWWASASANLRMDRLGVAQDHCIKGLAADRFDIQLNRCAIDIERRWRESFARRLVESGSSVRARARRRSAPESDERLDRMTSLAREAERRLEPLLKDRADSTKQSNDLAEYASLLIDRKSFAEARRYIDAALELDPLESALHSLDGRWHELQGEHRSALTAYLRAAELAPDDFDVRSLCGHMFARIGDRDSAFTYLRGVLDAAPNHMQSLIRLADLWVDLADKQDDVAAYERAVKTYDDIFRLHAAGSGSKFLSSVEVVDSHYQRGYCKLQLFDATFGAFRARPFVREARADFEYCLRVNPNHERALSAARVVKSGASRQSTRERVGPWLVVLCMLFIFVVAQWQYLGRETIGAGRYAALSFGAIVMAIAGLFLPELLKLKVAGVELEKSPVQQQRAPIAEQLNRDTGGQRSGSARA